MAASLTKEQGVALVKRLAVDDAFRALFEEKPAAALLELGMTDDEIGLLCESCLEPCKLAPKEEFLQVQKEMNEAELYATMKMMVPRARL